MSRKVNWIVLALLIIGTISCKEKKTNITELTIGHPTLRIALPVFVAQEKGYFEDEGLTINLKSYQTAQPMMDALVSGKIDVGGFCALPITFGAMARSKTELYFVGGMYEDNEHPISIAIIKDTANIKSIKDLKNKKIGILPTRAYEVWLQEILNSNGINPNEVVIRQIPPNLQANALNSGSVDALFTNDPAATITLSQNIGVRLSDIALVPNATGMSPFYFGSFNMRKDFADANPETAKKISRAIDKAISYINENPVEARLTMKEYLPQQQQKYVEDFPFSYFRNTNEVTNENLETIKDYYFSKKVLPVNISTDGLQYRN